MLHLNRPIQPQQGTTAQAVRKRPTEVSDSDASATSSGADESTKRQRLSPDLEQQVKEMSEDTKFVECTEV